MSVNTDTINTKAPSWFKMDPIQLATKRPYPWKTLFFLALLVIPACFAVIPYTFRLQSINLEPGELPAVLISVLINASIYCLMGAIGLLLAASIGLGLPFVEGWLSRKPRQERFRDTALMAIGVGLIASLFILVLSKWVFAPLMQAELDSLGIVIPKEIKPAPWQGFLASFYGGIVEEVMMRLFLMTLMAWLIGFLGRDAEGRPKPWVIWSTNLLAAVLFGLGHLPPTAAIGLPMSPLIVTRAFVLNGIGGVAFGWLYWKRGLESAMTAHFSADIVVHVITPMIVGLFAA